MGLVISSCKTLTGTKGWTEDHRHRWNENQDWTGNDVSCGLFLLPRGYQYNSSHRKRKRCSIQYYDEKNTGFQTRTKKSSPTKNYVL